MALVLKLPNSPFRVPGYLQQSDSDWCPEDSGYPIQIPVHLQQHTVVRAVKLPINPLRVPGFCNKQSVVRVLRLQIEKFWLRVSGMSPECIFNNQTVVGALNPPIFAFQVPGFLQETYSGTSREASYHHDSGIRTIATNIQWHVPWSFQLPRFGYQSFARNRQWYVS